MYGGVCRKQEELQQQVETLRQELEHERLQRMQAELSLKEVWSVCARVCLVCVSVLRARVQTKGEEGRRGQLAHPNVPSLTQKKTHALSAVPTVAPRATHKRV